MDVIQSFQTIHFFPQSIYYKAVTRKTAVSVI